MKFLPGKRTVIGLLAVAAVMMLPLAAGATTAFFDLGIPNADLDAFSSPYASVTITGGAKDGFLDPVSFTVVGLTGVRESDNSPYQYLLGSQLFGIMGLTPTSVTGYTQIGTGFSAPDFSISLGPSPSNNVGDFGNFTNVIHNEDGFKNAVASFTFSVSQQFDDANAALAFLQTHTNADGYFAASHIFATPIIGGAVNQANGAILTGFAGNGNQGVVVPLPPSVLLLGSGLLGLGLVGWRRKKV
jgi:hypothetical protein